MDIALDYWAPYLDILNEIRISVNKPGLTQEQREAGAEAIENVFVKSLAPEAKNELGVPDRMAELPEDIMLAMLKAVEDLDLI